MQSLRSRLLSYKENHLALPSFNIDTFLVYQAVENAVRTTNLPCIVQLSHGEDQFVQAERLFMLVQKARIDGLPIYLNMDHSQDIPRLQSLLKLGFDMVHFDGSHLSFEDNKSQSLALSTFIHNLYPQESNRPLLEVEFNKIHLVSDGVDPSSFTRPEQASDFIHTTGADLLAVSVGNLHGVPPSGLPEKIDTQLFSDIVASCPPFTLFTMHGGSGIDATDLALTIKNGVVKINVNTDLRLVYRETLKTSLNSLSTEKMYDYYTPVLDALTAVATKKLLQFSFT